MRRIAALALTALATTGALSTTTTARAGQDEVTGHRVVAAATTFGDCHPRLITAWPDRCARP